MAQEEFVNSYGSIRDEVERRPAITVELERAGTELDEHLQWQRFSNQGSCRAETFPG